MKNLCYALFLSLVLLLPGLLSATPILTTTQVEGTIFTTSVNTSTIDLYGFTIADSSYISINVLSWEKNPGGLNVDLNGDGEIAYLDTSIYLFSDDGILDSGDFIAKNDDTPSMEGYLDGSLTYDDSYMLQYLNTGNYILAIGAWDLTVAEIIAGVNHAEPDINDPNGYMPIWGGTIGGTDYFKNDHGDYAVAFTGTNVENVRPINPVPLPATIYLVGSGLIGLFSCIRRKQNGGNVNG